MGKRTLHGERPFSSDKNKTDSWIARNNAANMHGSQSVGTNIWLGVDVKMSLD